MAIGKNKIRIISKGPNHVILFICAFLTHTSDGFNQYRVVSILLSFSHHLSLKRSTLKGSLPVVNCVIQEHWSSNTIAIYGNFGKTGQKRPLERNKVHFTYLSSRASQMTGKREEKKDFSFDWKEEILLDSNWFSCKMPLRLLSTLKIIIHKTWQIGNWSAKTYPDSLGIRISLKVNRMYFPNEKWSFLKILSMNL